MIVDAVILAAGLSTRTFPENKLMLRVNGKAILEKTIESLEAVCDNIIVVTGSRAEDIESLIGSSPKVEVVYNPDYERGMYSSVKAGLKSIKGERIFILPGDCPLIKTVTPKEMLSIDSSIVIPTFNGEKGHPVLINRSEADRILLDTVHHSLREYLTDRPITETPVEDPGILWDIDTILEYEKMKSFLSKGGR